jgi:hypothetical protein
MLLIIGLSALNLMTLASSLRRVKSKEAQALQNDCNMLFGFVKQELYF